MVRTGTTTLETPLQFNKINRRFLQNRIFYFLFILSSKCREDFIEMFVVKEEYRFGFDVCSSSDDLAAADRQLLETARDITSKSLCPYSNFSGRRSAANNNEQVITGTNQENASYPVGICAADYWFLRLL